MYFWAERLIPHIPALPGKLLHKDQQDVNHSSFSQSGIHNCSGLQEPSNEMVNSSHHQAIEKPGSGLMITAFSEDGIAEAAELSDHDGQFCVAVQWHPERMEFENPLSGKLGTGFYKKNDE